MKTEIAALWLIALGSASLGSSVKLGDGNPFQEDLDREAAEGGGFDEQPFAPSTGPFAESEPEGRLPQIEEMEGKSVVDRKVRSVLMKVKRFFTGKALRRKAQLAESIDRLSKPQAEEIISCIGLASKTEMARGADVFCQRFEELTLRAMCLKTAEEAFKRVEAASAECQAKTGNCFLKELQIPLIHPMIHRRVEDPMMTRLLLNTLSFKKCSSRKLQLPGITESVSARHVRIRLLGSYFAAALRLDECTESPDTANCKTVRYYTRMSNTITKFFLPLHEKASINDDTPLYAGGELEASSEGEQNALREDIEEEVQSNVTFILEVAERLTTKLVDFISRSRLARSLITAAVANIMRLAGHLREEGQGEGPADGSRVAQSEFLKSAISLDATAQVAATVRELYVFVMTGRRSVARLYGQISYKILGRELKQLRKKSQPKRSLGQRIRRFFRFGRGQSSLQVENTSVLMPVDAHETMVKSVSRWTPRRMEASFLQSDKDKGFKKRNVYLLAGGTFIFLGIAVLSSVAPGALGIGLIVAGIVALLIPIVGKLIQAVTGRIRKAPKQPKLLALPAPPPREPEEPQPLEELREPEDDQAPQEAEASAEPVPRDNSEQNRDLLDEEVD
ncbi:hypothetical protein Emag_003729 [Eimeria magna]